MKATIENNPAIPETVKGLQNLTPGIWQEVAAPSRCIIVPKFCPSFDANLNVWDECFVLNIDDMQYSGNPRGEGWGGAEFRYVSPSISIVLKND